MDRAPVPVAEFRHTLFEVKDHVATVTLNRPEMRNALNYRAYDELAGAFLHASDDPDIRCVIVTGADPVFCSGEDVRAVMTDETPEAKARRQADPKPTPAAMAALGCKCPVIAAVNGAAVGWGMELTLFADIRIASEKAKFAELFVKRGLPCDVGGFYSLPAIVGPQVAARLLFTGDMIEAKEALEIGLVSEVTPHADLLAHANALAGRIAANPPLAVRALKDGLRLTRFGNPEEIGTWAIKEIYRLMKTEDHKEGVASFLEKRSPKFTGR